jgi:hypothetical protein
MPPLLAGLAHNSEPGDSVLLDWILDSFDAAIGLEPEAVVIILGVFIMLIPISIIALFVIQRARQGKA